MVVVVVVVVVVVLVVVVVVVVVVDVVVDEQSTVVELRREAEILCSHYTLNVESCDVIFLRPHTTINGWLEQCCSCTFP